VSERYPTETAEQREAAIEAASLAVQRGGLAVIPTDTVYGVAADAFDADAVRDLLAAKGRGRDMPPPVLVSAVTTLDALAVRVPAYARALVEEFWPGPLTIVCHAQPSLQWDLGDTRGTVAARMPDHEIALEILERTGPLAVSSANRTGEPAATDADQAEEMLGSEIDVLVDAGPSQMGDVPTASTIIDVTGARPRLLRHGVLGLEQLNVVLEPLGLALGNDTDELDAEAAHDDPTDEPTEA
jgi:L-threonylcarbamoyladenylate synthase